MKKILHIQGGGRFGNQLLCQMHLMAFALENPGCELYSFPFSKYLQELSGDVMELSYFREGGFRSTKLTRLLGLICNKNRNRIGNDYKGVRQISSILSNLPYVSYANTLRDDSKLNQFISSSHKVLIFENYLYRDWDLLDKHREAIVNKILSINRDRFCTNQIFTKKLKEKYKVIVGVFIRMGDYKNWNDGRFYFDLDFYKEKISEIKNSKVFGESVAFLIISDEIKSLHDFEDDSVYLASGNTKPGDNFYENFCQLADCDYLVSPPSTFSFTAKVLGNNKMLILDGRMDDVTVLDNYIRDISLLRASTELPVAIK